MNPQLKEWNDLPENEAKQRLVFCNGSEAWATWLCRMRPFSSVNALFVAADHAWWGVDAAAQTQAFASHPRIGENVAREASPQSLAWSSAEQQEVRAGQDASAAERLAEANRRYEAVFGHVFLICATGKTAEQILSSLQARLQNTPAAEWAECVEQQRRITQLRLRKWLGEPAAACDAV